MKIQVTVTQTFSVEVPDELAEYSENVARNTVNAHLEGQPTEGLMVLSSREMDFCRMQNV